MRDQDKKVKITKWDEARLKHWTSLVLQVGIALSMTLIIIGFIILIHISGFTNIQPLVRLEQIPAAIVISIGILLLLLTPIIQVFLSVIFFSRNRNRLFIGVSIAVLCLSAISLVLVLV